MAADPDEIRDALGLGPSASDADVVAALRGLGGTRTVPTSVWEQAQETIKNLAAQVSGGGGEGQASRLVESLNIRFSREEMRLIEGAAAAEGRSKGDLIRRIVNEALGPPGVPALPPRPPSELQARVARMEQELESLKQVLGRQSSNDSAISLAAAG